MGLVLEGGGMRGVFTAGVTDFFLDKKIEFDSVIGVSAGSCHACSFVSKQRGRALSVSIDYLNDKEYCSVYSLLKTGDLFGAEMLYKKIPTTLYPIDNEAFEKSKTTFKAVITNCKTGEAEYPEVKHLVKSIRYVRASSSLPFVSRIVGINGQPYLDGGIADSIPIKQSIKDGNTKNVVVLTRDRKYRKNENKLIELARGKYFKYPNLVKALKNRYLVYNETLEFIFEEEKKGNIFVIAPSEPLDLGRVEKSRDKLIAAYNVGYNQAEKQYEEMMKYLEITP